MAAKRSVPHETLPRKRLSRAANVAIEANVGRDGGSSSDDEKQAAPASITRDFEAGSKNMRQSPLEKPQSLLRRGSLSLKGSKTLKRLLPHLIGRPLPTVSLRRTGPRHQIGPLPRAHLKKAWSSERARVPATASP